MEIYNLSKLAKLGNSFHIKRLNILASKILWCWLPYFFHCQNWCSFFKATEVGMLLAMMCWHDCYLDKLLCYRFSFRVFIYASLWIILLVNWLIIFVDLWFVCCYHKLNYHWNVIELEFINCQHVGQKVQFVDQLLVAFPCNSFTHSLCLWAVFWLSAKFGILQSN